MEAIKLQNLLILLWKCSIVVILNLHAISCIVCKESSNIAWLMNKRAGVPWRIHLHIIAKQWSSILEQLKVFQLSMRNMFSKVQFEHCIDFAASFCPVQEIWKEWRCGVSKNCRTEVESIFAQRAPAYQCKANPRNAKYVCNGLLFCIRHCMWICQNFFPLIKLLETNLYAILINLLCPLPFQGLLVYTTLPYIVLLPIIYFFKLYCHVVSEPLSCRAIVHYLRYLAVINIVSSALYLKTLHRPHSSVTQGKGMIFLVNVFGTGREPFLMTIHVKRDLRRQLL